MATGSMYALSILLFNRAKRPEKNKSEEPKDMIGLGLFLAIQRSANVLDSQHKKNNKLIMNLVNEYRIRASGRGAFVRWDYKTHKVTESKQR
jgi:hypothetical protein